MTTDEKLKKIADILKSLDIEMSFGGCGCCGSPDFSFSYKGEPICQEEEGFYFSTKAGGLDDN